MRFIAALVCFSILSTLGLAQHDASAHEQHMADLKKHGAEAMGFDQDKTTHHFRLYKDGGAVEVQANDPADSGSIGQIRDHLKQQAEKFAAGDFSAPQHTHGQTPPGVETMTKLRSKIQYEFQATDTGGRLCITTGDAQALAAVHDFLRFQIKDHRTGDQTTQAGDRSVSQASSDTQCSEQDKKSSAYQSGFRDGKNDRSDNLRPRPRDQNWTSDADRRAYDSGYHAGFCAEEEGKTGYYNGTYSSSGPPVVRNGYYGYNAPNPECVNSARGH